MNIEIVGAGIHNRGSAMMLHAACQALDGPLRGHCMAVDHHTAPREERDRLGVRQVLRLKRLGSREGLPGRLVPRFMRERFGWVAEHEIRCLFDASGLAYADGFPLRPMERRLQLAMRCKQRGGHVILLPQALGPFTDPSVHAVFKAYAACADRIFVRDSVSMEHAKTCLENVSMLRPAPDFTHTLAPDLSLSLPAGKPIVGIVPNYRMIDMTDTNVAAHYKNFLAKCVQVSLKQGCNVVAILHEDRADREIIDWLADSFPGHIHSVADSSVARLKGAIARCRVLIASRFHALVSGLVQGVPCIGTGWAHKYNELFESYGCSECLLTPDAAEETISELLCSLLDGVYREETVGRLRDALQRDQLATTVMWNEIGQILATSTR